MSVAGDSQTRASWWAGAFAFAGTCLVVATAVFSQTQLATAAVVLDVRRMLELVAFLAFVLLGALLVRRRPAHPVGWLLAALGLAVLTQQATQEYALRSIAGGAGPAWQTASWIADWLTAVPLILLVEVLLLFPTGRPLSRAWGRLVMAVVVVGALLVGGRAVATWPQRGAELAIEGAVLPPGLTLLRLVLIVCLPLAVVALASRYRRGGHEQRQQLKLLLLAACGLVAAAAGALVASIMGLESGLLEALGIVSLAGVALAMTLAVLRYRLYEIDRVVSRTVSYGLLTTLLGTIYGIGVIVTGVVLEPVSPDSGLAVAASTLLVAGAFRPLRVRVQHLVDRRFNRSRYDAERLITAFRTHLRDELRVDSLHDELVTTVAATVQPARLSVWLRPHHSRVTAGSAGAAADAAVSPVPPQGA